LIQQSTVPALPVSTVPSALPLSSVPSFSEPPVYQPETITYSQSIPVQPQLAALAPLPVSTPTILPIAPVAESQPIYTQQSALLPTQIFTDASAVEGPRDIESLLDGLPESGTPYGSTASHRYSAVEEALPTQTSQPIYGTQQYSLPAEVIASEQIGSGYTIPAPVTPLASLTPIESVAPLASLTTIEPVAPLASLATAEPPALTAIEPLASVVSQPIYEPQAIEAAPLAPVEVASLGGGYFPMPRARPARIGPVFEQTAQAAVPAPAIEVASLAPIPSVRPQRLTTPLPKRRPVQLAALSGRAITDALALTAQPEMIEVEPVFLDDPSGKIASVEAPVIETAAATPYKIPEPPVADAPSLKVIEPKAPELPKAPKLAVASLQPKAVKPKAAAPKAAKPKAVQPKIVKPKAVQPKAVKPKAAVAAPRVEIAFDVGDLKELSGTSWRLSKLNGKDVPASAELHFDGGSGFAGGQGICNNYGGEFSETLKGDFDMSNIFSTETDCEHFRLEKKYIVALETASSYRMAPGLGELMLIGPDGKPIANFIAF